MTSDLHQRNANNGAQGAPAAGPAADDAASSRESFAAGLSALRGTPESLVQASASAAVALLATIYGASTMDGLADWARLFFYLSTLLMITSVLTAAKAVRDVALADVFEGQFWAAAVRGSQASRVQAYVVAAASLAAPYWAVASVNRAGKAAAAPSGLTDSFGFMLVNLLFVFSATLNASKAVRDRADAHFFEHDVPRATSDEAAAAARAVWRLSAGTSAFTALNFISAAAAVGSTFTGLWSYADLSRETKLLVSVSNLFMLYGAFQASRLVRDLRDASMRPPTAFYRVFTFAGFAASVALLFGALAAAPLTQMQLSFCAGSSLWGLSSVLSLAKLVRDQQEFSERAPEALRRR
jgi:hypothetical protein